MSDITTTNDEPDRPIATTQTGTVLNIIAQAAQDPNVNVEKLAALLTLQERILAKEAEREFTAALVRMNTNSLRVKKNGTVSLGDKKGSYKFATWSDMDKVIRPLMQKEGFILSFDTLEREGGGSIVIGTLRHEGGHERSARISLPLDVGAGRSNIQGAGSTLSYGKRYTTELLLNIVREDDDDDGVAAGTLYITEDQALQIETLLTETRADRVGFMRHFGVASILEITVPNFVPAVNMLNMKKAKMAKGQP